MHPLERRVARLEPRASKYDATYPSAKEELIKRIDRIRERMRLSGMPPLSEEAQQRGADEVREFFRVKFGRPF